MNLEVKALSRDQINAAVPLFAKHYKSDPSIQNFLNGLPESEQEKALSHYFRIIIGTCSDHDEAICVMLNGEVAGVGLFYPAETYPLAGISNLGFMIKTIFYLLPALGLKRFLRLSKISRQLEALKPTQPYIYAELSCVDPKYRKHGIGSSLIGYVNQKADKLGMPVYGETSNPQNVALWQKAGMEVLGVHQIEGISYWSMLRKPQPKLT